MKIVTEDDATIIIKALDHYADFLRATGRDDRPYREVIVRIQQSQAPPDQPERKAPVSEMPRVPRKRRAQT